MLLNCKACAYWYQLDNQPEWGECRAEPPSPIVTTKAGQPSFVGPYNYRAIWPYTRLIDWCGDGERRLTTKSELDFSLADQTVIAKDMSFDDAVRMAVVNAKGRKT
jgi:hypothetical protein